MGRALARPKGEGQEPRITIPQESGIHVAHPCDYTLTGRLRVQLCFPAQASSGAPATR